MGHFAGSIETDWGLILERARIVRLGNRLEYFTISYNLFEGLVALAAGISAGSVSLVAFGLDSFIEMTSASSLLWRLHHDKNIAERENLERSTLRVVGWCFIALAAYVGFEAAITLIHREQPERSIFGILIACLSLVIMQALARAKRKVAHDLESHAMKADSRQTDFCSYLSGILLGGLLLNAWLGWWWADPVAGLAMAPIIAKEGIDSLRGKSCCDECCHHLEIT
jgi:divalent metal cation (Fe/Co/Zn/Cd) transporter